MTASFPQGRSESFVLPELSALLEAGAGVLVVPLWPRGTFADPATARVRDQCVVRPLVSPSIALAALRTTARRPRAVVRILAVLLLRTRFRTALRNLAALPKGLWLAELVARERVDHIHAFWASVPATAALIASRVTGVPFSFTAHRWDISDDNLLAEKVRRASFARFISREGLELARRTLGGRIGGRAEVLHLGIPLPPPPGPAAARRRAIVLCPAGLIPRKGHDALLTAFRLLADRGLDAELWLAGEGPLEGPLRARVAELGVGDRVRFLGHLPRGRLLGLYERAEVDVVVLASRGEGIPAVLIEAMAHGVPVVATDVGGMHELVDAATGILVPPGDPPALAAAVERVLRSPELRASMTLAGREKVAEEFSAASAAARLLTLMSESVGPTR